MMTFSEFKVIFQNHFRDMTANVQHLFLADVDKDKLWETYLSSFPEGSNPIFRERTEHDCSCCRHFIKSFGNVVTIKDGKVTTLWDLVTGETNKVYQQVCDELSAFVKSAPILNVVCVNFRSVGTDHNFEMLDGSTTRRWDHFFLNIPEHLIYLGYKSEGEFHSDFKATHDVFRRSLDDISPDAVETVLELIYSNTLYRGEEWRQQLVNFQHYRWLWDKIEDERKRDLFLWEYTPEVGVSVGRIRNHSIGQLLLDISSGMDLEEAVRRYEHIVAPSNYKRPKAIFTKRMVEDAQKTIQEMGYLNSLGRRHATLNDVSVNNILFANRNAGRRMDGGDVFADLMGEAQSKPRKFDRVEEITAENFVKNVLPSARSVEVYLENRHTGNMVSLIAPKDEAAPSMFKWNNPFSWAYAGNMADSEIKQNVKSAGGNVNGVLRFSLQWNDAEYNGNDLDAHCTINDCQEIYFARKRVGTGSLDVDYITPERGKVCVENIVFEGYVDPGVYEFSVHHFSGGYQDEFSAEIEFGGQIFSYPKKVYRRNTQGRIPIATVRVAADGTMSIEHDQEHGTMSKDVWGVKTNEFIPVSTVMYSPNYWDEQEGIGHRHYFFMLEGCKNPETPNGFYNEFMKNDLIKQKRVFEALGSRMRVEPADDQLSGVGFASDKRSDVIVRVTGATQRVMKVKF